MFIFIYLYVYIFIYLYIDLFIYLFVYLFIYLYLLINLFIFIYLHTYIHLYSIQSGLRPYENYGLPYAYLQESHTCSIVICARLFYRVPLPSDKKREKYRMKLIYALKIWLPLRRFAHNLSNFNKVLWKNSVPISTKFNEKRSRFNLHLCAQ
jgi:hypothetical protein